MRRAAVLALFLAAVAAAPARADGGLTGRLLVSLGTHGTEARAAAPSVLARAAAVPAGRSVPQIGLVTVRPRSGRSLRALAARLRRDPAVRSVQPERRAVPRLLPDDPALTDAETAPGTPAGTVVEWWAARMGLPHAWDAVDGSGATVGIVDSGIDGGHPELAGKIRAAVDADPTPGAGGPLTDQQGHGTHVAGLACAASGDGLGIAGAGLGCGLVVVKSDFSDSSVAEGIVQAADHGVQALNLSFGTDGGRPAPQAIVDAIDYAVARNVVVVAAAADQDTEEQGDPANILQPTGTGPDLGQGIGLSVTAATQSDQRAVFAGRGTQISLAAYGAFEHGYGPHGLMSTWPAQETSFEQGDLGPPFEPPCRCRATYRGDSRYAYLQGTSMATALVSATAALVRELNPDLAARDVVRLLKETARRPAGTGWSPDLGWGIVDAGAATDAARLIDRHAPESRLRAPSRTHRRSILLRWSGSDPAPANVRASGIDRYEVWRSAYGRAARRIATTRATSRRVRARPGGRYAFFTIAVDRAGNREAMPAHADATTRALP